MAGTDTSAQQAAEQACDRLQLVVPDEIRRYKQWVLWRYEPGDDKPRKVPYYANGSRRSGVQGSESDLAQLSTFDAAVAKLRRGGFDGVGLAILPNSPIKAIDLDACVVAGKLLPQAEAIVVEADMSRARVTRDDRQHPTARWQTQPDAPAAGFSAAGIGRYIA